MDNRQYQQIARIEHLIEELIRIIGNSNQQIHQLTCKTQLLEQELLHLKQNPMNHKQSFMMKPRQARKI
ncbi:hypothetical protein [Falsibacillus albus]|uniref:Uncharacterized protein n=1 Tax=Falsibacillus albus TaxID=2478915 RepID=A0A3L7JXC0_9BACI|nr:hypothetical protein [Falsibacillus albus]RLQ94769.1 hypothetical protein D9X91_12300 [Falsibacillus albus]